MSTQLHKSTVRGGSWTAVTSKMQHFVIIVNGWKPLTIITKRCILVVAAVLDQPLTVVDDEDFLTKIQWQKNQTIFLDHEMRQIWL